MYYLEASGFGNLHRVEVGNGEFAAVPRFRLRLCQDSILLSSCTVYCFPSVLWSCSAYLIAFALQDDTCHMTEKKQENSGIPQGQLCESQMKAVLESMPCVR